MKTRLLFLFLLIWVWTIFGCNPPVQSISGIEMIKGVKIPTNPNGFTVEQENVSQRIAMDNQIGAIKHLYVISAYSGQVIIYSTVKGKITSSGKRLTPNHTIGSSGFQFRVEGDRTLLYTDEVLGEDGTFGPSIEYLYWWDTRGIYHQHYVAGGHIIHVSDQPLAVKNILINMAIETSQ